MPQGNTRNIFRLTIEVINTLTGTGDTDIVDAFVWRPKC